MRREKAAFTALLFFRCCSLRFGDRALPLGGLESILAGIVGGTRRGSSCPLSVDRWSGDAWGIKIFVMYGCEKWSVSRRDVVLRKSPQVRGTKSRNLEKTV